MSANTQDRLAEFRRNEHAGWKRLAGGYDTYFRDVAAQMIDPILDAAGVAAGTRVLDLCCGPGYVVLPARASAVHRRLASTIPRRWLR